ncbi:unnamed protein product [Rhizophagus irregularis]|nr:unnamed protein product [Rhizophagus irregularis]
MTSEEWKKPSFVQWAFKFQRITKNQDLFRVSQVVFQRTEYLKIHKFLSVLRHWIYRFGFQFLGVEYTDFSSWILDIWISVFGYWALDRFPL